MEPPTIRLALRVSPAADRSAVVGRYGDAWKLRVAAAPERGRANASVVDLLASSLELARPDVRIVAGTASRDKIVEIVGLSLEEAERRLTSVQKRSTMSIDLALRRAELLRLRERILRAAADMVADDEGAGEINTAAGDHIADHASDLVDLEVDQSLAENAENVVAEIDEALWRIEAGTYGTCAVCGADIPEERLEAIPYAVLCLDDKRRQEQG